MAACLLLASLAGCGSLSGSVSRDTFKPYVPEVVQGNFVSNEQRQALRPGMARAQVREILGTPLIASLFHANRWDYVYMFTEGHKETRSRRLTVIFEGDTLLRLEGDVVGRPAGEAPPEAGR